MSLDHKFRPWTSVGRIQVFMISGGSNVLLEDGPFGNSFPYHAFCQKHVLKTRFENEVLSFILKT